MNIGHLLNLLESRLPELEWRIASLHPGSFTESALPKGLFRPCLSPAPAFFVDEIRSDIKTLANQESNACAHYLAKRIHHKINVLIALCRETVKEPTNAARFDDFTGIITTRKNHIEMLERELTNLKTQKKSMEKSSTDLQQKNQLEAFMSIQRELGSLEKRLTLISEELRRIVGK